MVGLLAPTLLVLSIGALRGERRATWPGIGIGIRGWPALLVAFGLELVLYNPPADDQAWAIQLGPWIWVGTKLLMLAVAAYNVWPASGRSLCWPMLAVAVGLALNTVVLVVNAGHMPQSPAAAVAVWGASHIRADRLENVAPMAADTRLAALGDVLPEPAWLPHANVISPGDVLVALGAAWWVAFAMRVPERGKEVARAGV